MLIGVVVSVLVGNGNAWLVRDRDCKTFLFGYRLHHGLVGAVFAALGVFLMVDDWKDFPWRVSD